MLEQASIEFLHVRDQSVDRLDCFLSGGVVNLGASCPFGRIAGRPFVVREFFVGKLAAEVSCPHRRPWRHASAEGAEGRVQTAEWGGAGRAGWGVRQADDVTRCVRQSVPRSKLRRSCKAADSTSVIAGERLITFRLTLGWPIGSVTAQAVLCAWRLDLLLEAHAKRGPSPF